jgi:3-oxoacyl-[acyl-carrier protein] reductase
MPSSSVKELFDLSGKVAMVTGGGTGIGAAIVERLALLGAKVACAYNKSRASAEALAEKLAEQGKSILLVKVDVTSEADVSNAVEEIARHFGSSVDILVNNAGDNIHPTTVDEMDKTLGDEVIGINLGGAFLCSKHCIPGMKINKSGRIVNITSISARTGGGPGSAHYVASKAGLEGFTRALAKEMAPFHVTVNGIAPGLIYTPIHERTNTPESLEKLRQMIPLARIGTPEETAHLVAFLASKNASYITGEIIAVNGGLRMD